MKEGVSSALTGVKSRLEKAEEEIRRLKKKTWRAETPFGNLLKVLKSKGVDTAPLEVLEKQILLKHEECANHLKAAVDVFDEATFKDDLDEYNTDIPTYPYTFGGGALPAIKGALDNLKVYIDDIKKDLARAIAAQEEAKTDLEGVIAEAEKMLA